VGGCAASWAIAAGQKTAIRNNLLPAKQPAITVDPVPIQFNFTVISSIYRLPANPQSLYTKSISATLNPEIIEAAIEGFETQRARLDEQISELRAMLGDTGRVSTAVAPNGARRQIGAAAHRRMAAGQRRRWATA